MRKLILGCIGCVAVTLVAFASSAAAQSFDVCQLNGSADFSPGLNSTSKMFTYTLTGTVSGCESDPAGAPESGTIEAGQVVTEEVRNSITHATDTVSYQWPLPYGEGTCASLTTRGYALVTWVDGTHTIEVYETKGSLSSAFEGGVWASVTMSAINAQPGDPETYTIKTNRFADFETIEGSLVFQPSEPAACTTSTGVTTATISGAQSINTAASTAAEPPV